MGEILAGAAFFACGLVQYRRCVFLCIVKVVLRGVCCFLGKGGVGEGGGGRDSNLPVKIPGSFAHGVNMI